MQLGSALDRQIFDQQNELRMNPRSFIPHLEARMKNFNGNIFVPGGSQPIEDTTEGPTAVQMAIQALEVQSELPPLEWNDGLYIAAQDHCLDAGQNNLTSWLGSDGSNPGTRIAKYGTAGPSQGQNLAYGSSKNGIDIVMQLIIDDGAPMRTSRQVIFNPNYRLTGIATCAHQTRTMMSSLLYTDYYKMNQVGMQKVEQNVNSNIHPVAVKPTYIPGAQIRPLVRGDNAQLDRGVYYWQNKLRTDPGELVDDLEKLKVSWSDLKEPEAVEKAIKLLKELQETGRGLPALEWNEGLNLSAKSHCDDLGPLGLIGHFGSNESSPYDRILKFGEPGWWRGENLSYNDFSVSTDENVDDKAKDLVLKMFVDAGWAGRPNRSRMLNPEFNLVGIYSCEHKQSGALDRSMTVLDYSGTLKTNDNTKQGVMEAQEKNSIGENGPEFADDAPANEDFLDIKRCTELPRSVVSRETCQVFDINNKIRTEPESFIQMLEERRRDIEQDDQVKMMAGSQLPTTAMDKDYKTYDNLIKTERAISALKRQTKLHALKWSDALFLSVHEHCEQQANDPNQSIFTNVFANDKQSKQRPSTAAEKFANATDVELTHSSGPTIMDTVIDNLLDPANRSILLNPGSYYSGVQTCKNEAEDKTITIQNFARTVEPNAEGNKKIEEMMKEPDVVDECGAQDNDLEKEKGTLQRLLISHMRQEADAMAKRDKDAEEIVNFKIRATIQALKQVDEQVADAQKTAEKRQKAAVELLICQRELPIHKERAEIAQEEFSNQLRAANQRTVLQAREKAQKLQTKYETEESRCQVLEAFALCKKAPSEASEATADATPASEAAVETSQLVVGVFSQDNSMMDSLNENDFQSLDQDSLDAGLEDDMVGDDGGLFSGNDYYLETAKRRYSPGLIELSEVGISGTTIAFGSPDFAL